MVEHVENSCLIESLRVFADILLVVQNKLALQLQCSLERASAYMGGDNRRHAAKHAVIHKCRGEDVHFHFREWRSITQVGEHAFDDGLIIREPIEIPQVQRSHFVVGLISRYCFDLLIADAQH